MSNPINTRAGKREFIRSLCNSIRNEALSKVPRMPAEWDGHELREYLSEQFESAASMSLVGKSRKRYTAYRHACYNHNL